MEDFHVVGPSFVVTGNDEAELAAAADGTRQQIAFYGSTPAYRAVLDLHGWGGLQDELNALSKQGRWAEMGHLIDDDILNTFAVVGEPEQIAPELHRRYGDVIQRILVLRALPQRPGTLAAGARRPQGGMTPSPFVRESVVRTTISRTKAIRRARLQRTVARCRTTFRSSSTPPIPTTRPTGGRRRWGGSSNRATPSSSAA